MSTTHRTASLRSRLVPARLGLGAVVLGFVLAGSSAQAAPPAESEAAAEQTKPRAPTTRGLDDTARRALRASSSADEDAPAGERVAMRTAAPAEPAASDPPKRRKSKQKAERSRGKGDDDARAPSDDDARKISLDEDFLVEGRLEKPNAFYILRRSQSGYDWARLDAKFLPLVLESVQDPLF